MQNLINNLHAAGLAPIVLDEPPTLRDIVREAGFFPYRPESSYPDTNAERNLSGRTPYQENAAYHNARTVSSWDAADGLLFVLVESIPSDYKSRTRVRRAVIFDVFGDVLKQTEPRHKTDGAIADAHAYVQAFDLKAHYKKQLERTAAQARQQAARAAEAADRIRFTA